MRSWSLLSCFLLLFMGSQAQQFGGHPLSHHWRQVNTDTVRVIYHAIPGMDSIAKQVASISGQLGATTTESLGDQLRKVSIVLQDQTTTANGYVGQGPWRSEFQLAPNLNSFELGSLPWYRTLALHEYRHIQQYSNFRKGASRLMYYLFGQEGQDLANSAAVPNWFWEGDAVHQETALSRQGRGRLPYFFNGYHSLWASHKDYSWMKLRNGSLRDFVPDHYKLGYMIVSYGYEKYGDDFWRKVTDDAIRYKGLIYPFQRAIKKYSGLSYAAFRTQALDFYRSQLPVTQVEGPAAEYGAAHRHFAGNAAFPQWIDDRQVVLVRDSYKDIPAFMIRDMVTGEEKLLRKKDISGDDYFSYRNGKIVYAAREPSARWSWEDYNVLRVLDVKTGQQQTITGKTRYFQPDISADGRYVLAVLSIPGDTCWLHFMDVRDGTVLQQTPNPHNYVYTYPKLLDAHHAVSAIRNTAGEMALGTVNLESGAVDWLTPFSMNVIGYVQVQDSLITFSMAQDGLDRLFAVRDKQLYRFEPDAANAATGSYQLATRGNHYTWVDFTAVGDHLRYDTTGITWTAVDPGALKQAPATHGLTRLPAGSLGSANLMGAMYTTHPYSQSFHLLNVHSWRPYVEDPEYTFSVVSENVLNTLQSEAYFNYNRNEKSKEVGVTASYAALLPWINIGSSYIFDRLGYLSDSRSIRFNEWQMRAGLSVPVTLNRGRYYRGLSLGADYVYTKRYFRGAIKDSLDDRPFGYVRSYLSFYNQVQTARQQIYPRWAQSITLRYSRAVSLTEGNQFTGNANWYLPGLSKTHNLVINTAFQQRDTLANVSFTNYFPFSRGYESYNFERMWKLGGNYHLPLAYPDWGFGNIVYFLRVRANVFFDYTYARVQYRSGERGNEAFRSYGTEVFFDTKWWNEYDVNFGFRYSRLMDGALVGQGPNQWEFVLPVSILGR